MTRKRSSLKYSGTSPSTRRAKSSKLASAAVVGVALELPVLDPLDQGRDLRVARLHVDADLAEARHQVGAPGLIGDHHVAPVADPCRLDVLVGPRVLGDRRDVQPALVGKGAVADIGGVLGRRPVEPLVEHVRDRRVSCSRRSAGRPMSKRRFFSARLGIREIRLALPQRSPRPLIVPCSWRAPASSAARELATAFSVSLWV